VQALLERDGRIVVPVVLIGLGAYVVADAAFG
jgi:cadmium resistance protein CadD (predicted permease)